MSDAVENEIYQELYAIRSLMQSMDMRELSTIRQELQKVNQQLASINAAVGGAPPGPGDDMKQRTKGMLGFFK
ncbi:MAG: hypothetical protein PHG85_07040 [Candidatus Altiarchaeota archaeon]|nr:hypothetical protein [Candidatus Altiarchaeota archaeon]